MAPAKAAPKSRISQDVQALGIIVTNIRKNPEIGEAMGTVGYGPLRLDVVHESYAGTSDLVSRQVSAVGAAREATAKLKLASRVARRAILTVVEACRHEFRAEPALLAKVGANQAVPKPVAQLTTMGLAVLTNAASDPAIAARLAANFGYTPERFASERESVDALIAARRNKEDAKGAAQQATADQKDAVTKLRRELSAIRGMARQALRDKPQLLEKLGITARTSKTAAQRGAGKKAATTRKAKKDAGAPAGP